MRSALAVIVVLVLLYWGTLAWLARPLPVPEQRGARDAGVPAMSQPRSPPSAGQPSADLGSAPATTAVPVGLGGRLPPQTATGTVGTASAGDRGGTGGPAPTFVDADGKTRQVRNYTRFEAAERNAARERALASLEQEARQNVAAFAAANDLEQEDVRRMVEGERPFPERLIDSRLRQ